MLKKISDTLHEGELKNANIFSDFTFLEKGIVVNGTSFPIVKMEWINGLTLGEFINKNHNAKFFKSLGSELYFSCAKNFDLIIGNSSSGIIESPSLKKPAINIGSRQKGRISSKNIIACGGGRKIMYFVDRLENYI